LGFLNFATVPAQWRLASHFQQLVSDTQASFIQLGGGAYRGLISPAFLCSHFTGRRQENARPRSAGHHRNLPQSHRQPRCRGVSKQVV